MKIEVYGFEIEINIEGSSIQNATLPAQRPLLRDTDPNELRKQKIKKDFGPIDITRASL